MDKKCSKCKEVKSLTDFGKQTASRDGLRNQCKVCIRLGNREYCEINKDERKAYREENKGKIKATKKIHYEKNKDKIKASREENKDKIKAYREENKDKIKAYQEANKDKRKAWQEANKDKLKAWREENKDRAKAWREDNKDKLAVKARVYRDENKDKIKVWQKEGRERAKSQRIEDLCRTFGKGESEVNGTIYHFRIGDGFKIGKAINGFEKRYSNADKDQAQDVTEWVMNTDDMHKLEKVILHKTKEYQYDGPKLLRCTGNREVRTVDCEGIIDSLILELKIDCEKV